MNGQMTQAEMMEQLKQIPQATPEKMLAAMKEEIPKEELQFARDFFNNLPSEAKKNALTNAKEVCNKFMETSEYKNGKTNCVGYVICCDWLGFCGGVSGWIIALIVLMILGMCASGAAAFFFFYWRRKNGGQEAKEEEEEETTDDTVMEVSIENY